MLKQENENKVDLAIVKENGMTFEIQSLVFTVILGTFLGQPRRMILI